MYIKKALILITYVLAIGCAGTAAYDPEVIKAEALQVAENWSNAWNGEINLESMMSLHHEELQYYWHGKPMSYDGFKNVLQEYVIRTPLFGWRPAERYGS